MATGLTVVTFLYGGPDRDYKIEHVETLRRMCAMHITMPHVFVCVTDRVQHRVRTATVEYVPMWNRPPKPAGAKQDNFVKLGVFGEPGEIISGFGAPLLVLDLDTVIRGNIDNLVTLRDYGNNAKMLRYRDASHYLGAQWLLRAGCCEEIWEAAHDDARLAAIRANSGRGSLTEEDILSAYLMVNGIAAWDVTEWTERDGITVTDDVATMRGWRIWHGGGAMKPWLNWSPVHSVYNKYVQQATTSQQEPRPEPYP